MTFLRNHQDAIAAMNFCVVPTVSFQLLYVWFVIDHGRRRLIQSSIARWRKTSLRRESNSTNSRRLSSSASRAIVSGFVLNSSRRACTASCVAERVEGARSGTELGRRR
jgi:hypothetical protein